MDTDTRADGVSLIQIVWPFRQYNTTLRVKFYLNLDGFSLVEQI